MDNTACPKRELWLLPFSGKKDTFKSLVVRGIVASIQVDIYSVFQRLNGATLQKSVSFKDGEQVKFTTKKNFVIKEPVQDKLLVCIFVCVWVCFSKEDCFPMVLEFCRAAKKPDSEPSRRSIVEERIPRWLCKLKPSIAEQAENRHGLQFVPSAWLVALWNLTESEEGPT